VSTLTVATWNLQRVRPGANERVEVMRNQMESIGADVWVLTETSESVTPPGHTYVVSSPWAGAPYAADERGVMIWSRRPLRQVQALPFLSTARSEPADHLSYALISQDMAPVACALAETPVGPVLIYGTIITWPGDVGPRGGIGNGEAQRQAIDAQAADWTSLRSGFRNTPLIVAGDFNVSLSGRAYPSHDIRDHLVGALDQAGLGCSTARLEGPGGVPTVDHICLAGTLGSGRIEVGLFPPEPNPRSATRQPVSDHSGVWARYSA
jgi:endonuclease/exonuclease/phosphatase family metal-dependent hydrolase